MSALPNQWTILGPDNIMCVKNGHVFSNINLLNNSCPTCTRSMQRAQAQKQLKKELDAITNLDAMQAKCHDKQIFLFRESSRLEGSKLIVKFSVDKL